MSRRRRRRRRRRRKKENEQPRGGEASRKRGWGRGEGQRREDARAPVTLQPRHEKREKAARDWAGKRHLPHNTQKVRANSRARRPSSSPCSGAPSGRESLRSGPPGTTGGLGSSRDRAEAPPSYSQHSTLSIIFRPQKQKASSKYPGSSEAEGGVGVSVKEVRDDSKTNQTINQFYSDDDDDDDDDAFVFLSWSPIEGRRAPCLS